MLATRNSLTDGDGAKLGARVQAEPTRTVLNCAQLHRRHLRRAAIFAGHVPLRASLGVKGSQVQILSSRRRDRAVSPSETPPDLRSDLGKRLRTMITSGSSVDLADGRFPLARGIWSKSGARRRDGEMGSGSAPDFRACWRRLVTVRRTSRRMPGRSSARSSVWRPGVKGSSMIRSIAERLCLAVKGSGVRIPSAPLLR